MVSDLSVAGLPIASIIRPAKIATIDARDAEPLGVLARADRPAIANYLLQLLAPVFN
jgi:mRNA interferase MazF